MPRLRHRSSPVAACALLGLALGCANPGPPKQPSLDLPEPAGDLSAARVGDAVDLSFSVPTRSTDKLPLREPSVSAVLCRQVAGQPCQPIAGFAGAHALPVLAPDGFASVAHWHDPLPAALTTGAPQPIAYRVQLFNAQGRSAGWSDPAYAAAGPAPAPVKGLRAEGSRLGVVLTWSATPAKADGVRILLFRQDLAPPVTPGSRPAPALSSGTPNSGTPRAAPATRGSALHATTPPAAALPAKPKPRPEDPNLVLLDTHTAGTTDIAEAGSLDAAIQPDTPYSYIAVRQTTVQLGGRTLTLRSQPSAAVTITLHEVYPPPVPAGLTVVGFTDAPPAANAADTPTAFAADLIWQPVDDRGLLAPFAGYNVYRQPLDPDGRPVGPRLRLNATPLLQPAFHDPSVRPAQHLLYSVTSIDRRGNESAAATATLLPAKP